MPNTEILRISFLPQDTVFAFMDFLSPGADGHKSKVLV